MIHNEKKKRRYHWVAIALLGTAAVVIVACLWWWALLGLDSKIGEAIAGTTVIMVVVAVGILTWLYG